MTIKADLNTIDIRRIQEILVSPNRLEKIEKECILAERFGAGPNDMLFGMKICVSHLIPDNWAVLVEPRDPNDILKPPEMVILEFGDEEESED